MAWEPHKRFCGALLWTHEPHFSTDLKHFRVLKSSSNLRNIRLVFVTIADPPSHPRAQAAQVKRLLRPVSGDGWARRQLQSAAEAASARSRTKSVALGMSFTQKLGFAALTKVGSVAHGAAGRKAAHAGTLPRSHAPTLACLLVSGLNANALSRGGALFAAALWPWRDPSALLLHCSDKSCSSR